VAFFLENAAVSKVDFSRPLEGNPGVGATEYMTVVVASELAKKGIDVTLITTSNGTFPTGLRVATVKNSQEAISFAAQRRLLLFIRAYISGFEDVLHEVINYQELKVAIWAHLTPSQKSMSLIANIPQVIAVICLENNQRVRLGDSLAQAKLYTIPYGITGNTELIPASCNPNNIVYMGALVPQKSFHLLADSWPQVKEAIADAKLFVLGSGRLYNSHAQIGPYGIATKEYEDRIFRVLRRDDESVIFMGNADQALRDSILNSCRLGVVNPSAQTETFCLSAIEFQQRGIPVIGGRNFGLLDTVKHKQTGLLVLDTSRLHRHIINLCADNYTIKKYGLQARDYVLSKYDLSNIIDRWLNLIENLSGNFEVAIDVDTKRMKVRSLQGLLVIVNKRFTMFLPGRWPTLVSLWTSIKAVASFRFFFSQNNSK